MYDSTSRISWLLDAMCIMSAIVPLGAGPSILCLGNPGPGQPKTRTHWTAILLMEQNPAD
jgi:hypothetical protein